MDWSGTPHLAQHKKLSLCHKILSGLKLGGVCQTWSVSHYCGPITWAFEKVFIFFENTIFQRKKSDTLTGMLERTNFLSKQKKIVYLPENKLFLRLV